MENKCKQCGEKYQIDQKDLDFFEKVSPEFKGKKYLIPPPTCCPDCRQQRRLAFRNERKLYHRKCDKSGKQMISMFPADVDFPVYHISEWQGDDWDPRDYGQEFDFNRPFFEQFKELCDRVPHYSLFVDPLLDQNSDFTNCASESKNCYLISQAERNEDCAYSRGINNCKDCLDCLRINHSELCYECINVSNSYHCFYLQDCDNCSDCYFSTNLKSCRNCFGCHGLVNKEYYYFNEPLSKEEWNKKIESLRFTYSFVEEMKKKSDQDRLTYPQKYAHIIQCTDSMGDHIIQCKDSQFVFDSKNLEGCKYCYEVLNGAKFCMDYTMWGINCELLYECIGCGYNVYNTAFSDHCWQNISYLYYCQSCFPAVKNCFGCFGLRRSEYCILNKQYTKEEYEEMVPRIIEHMIKTEEFGEFSPIEISPYPYNESDAQEFFPLSKEEVLEKGWNWRDEEDFNSKYRGPDVEIPEDVADVDEGICKKILICEETGRPYKIIPFELKFLKNKGLPVPKICPEQRHRNRMKKRTPRKLWDRECDCCHKSLKSTYKVDRPEKIYCEECYLKEVYE